SGRTQQQGYSQVDNVRQKFTAYEHDAETNLEFAEARYYSSSGGRFTSPDPFSGSMSLTDPQTLNRYSYVSNNPVNATDPSGMKGIGGMNCPGCAGIQTAQYSREIDDFTDALPEVYEERQQQQVSAIAAGDHMNEMLTEGKALAAADTGNDNVAAAAPQKDYLGDAVPGNTGIDDRFN